MITFRKIVIVAGLLLLILPACIPTGDVSDTVQTVDKAVSMLQDLEKRSTGQTVTDGLDALNDQNGYTATVHLQQGALDASGAVIGTVERDIVISLTADAATHAVIQVTQDNQTKDYFIDGFGGPSPARAYRVQDGRYTCASDEADLRQFDGGLAGVFDHYGVTAAGVRVLSVAKKSTGDTSIADRKTTRYDLESLIPDALAILDTVDNEELQQQVKQAGNVDYSGELYLDKDTQALMSFSTTVDDLDAGRRVEFTFTITQWGISDITAPSEDMIVEPCS